MMFGFQFTTLYGMINIRSDTRHQNITINNLYNIIVVHLFTGKARRFN